MFLLARPRTVLTIYRKWASHGARYLRKCAEQGLTPNHLAVPKPTTEDLNEGGSTLDSFVKKVPKWTQQGLLDHIVELIVSDDQVMRHSNLSSVCMY